MWSSVANQGVGSNRMTIVSRAVASAWMCPFFFQAEDGIRDLVRSRGLGDVYKRQSNNSASGKEINTLEDTILDFIDHKYDVLICTNIVESGVDIPNVNTIIINNAHQFGLSDLHQLRGRVGRSNKKAFCYLVAPPMSLSLIHISEPTRPY